MIDKKSAKGLFALFFLTTIAASGDVITGAGYSVPALLLVAPGQVVTLFVQTNAIGLTAPVASSGYPLPTTLAGISVSMTQMLAPLGPIAVPILSVFPASTCSAASTNGCSNYLGITVQIPFELVPSHQEPGGTFAANQAMLTVAQNGISTVIQGSPVLDQIHVLRQQDTIFTLGVPVTSGAENSALVTHADGSVVTQNNLAVAGETLVIYAVGLGPTTPGVATGVASPSPAPMADASAVAVNFSPDVGPGWPYWPGVLVGGDGVPSAPVQNIPAFAGLVPGYAGLYQINFVVPPIPSGYSSQCGVDARFSNLTLSLVGFTSFDGAGICVAVR